MHKKGNENNSPKILETLNTKAYNILEEANNFTAASNAPPEAYKDF